jgi:pimeloyl-ACP methyl ester carboxylesterase
VTAHADIDHGAPSPDDNRDVAVADVTDELIPIRPDLRLATRRWAAGTGVPAFVLVHGLASNARLWDGVARRLAEAGHPVVAVDQRGHGRSDAPHDGYDFATVTDDLRLLLARCGLDRPVLVGQSWGGNVVLEAAARWGHQLAGVAAVDGGTIDLQHRFAEWEACAERLAPPAFDGLTRAGVERMLRDSHPDWPDEGITGTLANFAERPDGTVHPRLRRDRHMQILRALWEQRPSEHYAAVDVPMLLIPADTGDTDWTSDKRRDIDHAADGLAHARVQWLAGAHDLHAQRPGAVVATLLDAVADGFFR